MCERTFNSAALLLLAGVRKQVGHAATRQGATSGRREEPQVRPVSQVFPDVAAVDATLARTLQRPQVPVSLLREVV